jgi:hypothetical protein
MSEAALVGNLRVIVSLCQGGSTALTHSLAHAPVLLFRARKEALRQEPAAS